MKFFVNGEEVELQASGVEVQKLVDRLVVKTERGAETAVAVRSGDATLVSFRGRQYRIERNRPRSAAQGSAASGELRAPMPGQIVDVLVAEGSSVKKGDKILVLEAMKTQQAFTSPFDGTLTSLKVSKGEQVIDGALLATIGPIDAT